VVVDLRISHAFGVVVCGFTQKYVNCNVECMILLFMCMFIYQTMVEVVLILRRNLTNGCLM
jgi:hypothetical protein